MPSQAEFEFEGPARSDGLAQWHEQRRQAMRRVAERLGLPLDRRVEVRLADGVILEGRLELRDHLLFPEQAEVANVELQIGRVNFRHSEIESCVCLE